MPDQLALCFDAASADSSVDYAEQAREFDRDNPMVMEWFSRFVREAVRARPGKRIGSRLIWERVRWETYFATNGSEYRLNDHFAPHFARMYVERHPEHADAFEFRRLRR